MSSPESPSSPEAPPPVATPPHPAATAADAPPIPPGRLWALALGAAVLAGAVSWLGGTSIRGAFLPVESTSVGEAMQEADRQYLAGLATESTLAYGMLGGALGLALGLAGGLARRSATAAVVAAVVGLVLGAGAAAGTAAALSPIAYGDLLRLTEDFTLPLLILGGIWSALGLATGLALGIGLGGRDRMLRAAGGGLLGAGLAAVLYQVVAAVAFPLILAGGALAAPLTQGAAASQQAAVAGLAARLAAALVTAIGAVAIVQAQPRPHPARGDRAQAAGASAAPLPD